MIEITHHRCDHDAPPPPAHTLAARLAGRPDAPGPTLVLMHFLGGSAREWDEVVALLGENVRTVALDLPGFGDSHAIPGYTVAEMADLVEAAIHQHVHGPYLLVGHSMSGKVATVLARRAEDALSGPDRHDHTLAGLVLVAPSPPSPEPMDDSKRSMMVGLLGERHPDDRARARRYITKNEARDIAPAVEDRASREVMRMNRSAWTAWVERGSREDWSARVGVLRTPALVLAGEKDLSLGPPQQREHTLPHLAHGELRIVENCSHLIPMERPREMAAALRGFHAMLTRRPSATAIPTRSEHAA